MSIFDEWKTIDFIEAIEELDRDVSVDIDNPWEIEFIETILHKKQKYDIIYLTPRQRLKCIELLRKYSDDYE